MSFARFLARALSLSALLSVPAFAATGVDVDISRVELSTQPGGTLNGSVKAINSGQIGEAPLAVNAYFSDFLLPQSGTAKFMSPGSSSNSLASWVRFTPDNFSLAPKVEQQVKYTIQVPPDAKPGLYWGVLFFHSDDKSRAQLNTTKGVTLNYLVDVGQIIYVQVGSPKLEGKMSALAASFEGGRVNVSATVKNTGNSLIRALGRAQVRDKTGKVLLTLPVGESVALPGYSRNFEGQAEGALPPGEYQVLVALNYAKGKFFTGETKLEVK